MIPAVVATASSNPGLDVIRVLGSRGVPVIGVYARGGSQENSGRVSRASRYLQAAVTMGEGEDLIGTLLQLGSQLPRGGILIPVTDGDMLAISRARKQLLPFFRLLMPPAGTIEALLDKNRFAELAQQHEIPVPSSFPVSDEETLRLAARSTRFPCIVKPPWRDANWSNIHHDVKVLRARSMEELLAGGRDVLRSCGHCLVQEIVQGPESNIRCAFAFLDANSQPVTLSVCRKLRQYPPYFGDTALAESVRQPEVEQLTRSICQKLGLVGYVSIEFKRDPATDRWLVLEITPSRVNRQAAGVTEIARRSIMAAWYATLAEIPIDPVRPLRTGVCWVSPSNDLRSLRLYLRNHDWTLLAWVSSYLRVRHCELFSLRDPLPGLVKLGFIRQFFRHSVESSHDNKAHGSEK